MGRAVNPLFSNLGGALPPLPTNFLESRVVRVISPWDAVKAGSYVDEEGWVNAYWNWLHWLGRVSLVREIQSK